MDPIIIAAIIGVFPAMGSLLWQIIGNIKQGKWTKIAYASIFFLLLVASIIVLSIFSSKYFSYLPVPKVGERYEWQWAGENWIGEVAFFKKEKDSLNAQIYVNKIRNIIDQEGRVTLEPPIEVLRSTLDGDVLELKDGGIKLILPVRKNTFDPEAQYRIISTSKETLKAKLYPTKAFVGKVEYINENGVLKGKGDMVLINAKSTIELCP
ncbi:MAG: hypothetical protein AB1422_10105 [bacterium]